MQDFGCADELVALGSVHRSVRPDPQRVVLRLDQLYVTEAEAALDQQLLRHSQGGRGERSKVEKRHASMCPHPIYVTNHFVYAGCSCITPAYWYHNALKCKTLILRCRLCILSLLLPSAHPGPQCTPLHPQSLTGECMAMRKCVHCLCTH